MANKVGYAVGTQGALTDVDTTQRNPLGVRQFDDAGNEYIYLAGVASTAAGDWVRYANNLANAVTQAYGTSRVNNDAVAGPVAVAMAAVLANQFGWYQIFGLVASAALTTGSVDGSQLSLSATAGRLSAASTATKVVYNAFGIGTAASNLGKAFIAYPYTFGAAPA